MFGRESTNVRPMYETTEDLKREERALQLFSNRFGLEWKKIRRLDSYTPDATFWRDDERVGVGEVKCRTFEIGRYPTYLISKAKIDSIVERWHPVPMVLIVSWVNETAWTLATFEQIEKWEVQRGGRTDRGDDMDIEDCYMIPIDKFCSLTKQP